MSTVVTILDRDSWDANTDNVVLVEPASRRLLWIPRDLWCEGIGDRINAAFALGGHELLLAALAEHQLRVDSSLCLLRGAVERFLARVTVTVPVPERLEFRYPLKPTAELQDGEKRIVFDPPRETLHGERLHQWVGARYRINGVGTDLDRIERQKVLLRRLLQDGPSFDAVLEAPKLFSWTGSELVEELAQVALDWRFETLSDVSLQTIDGKIVLVNRRSSPRRS